MSGLGGAKLPALAEKVTYSSAPGHD